METAILRLMSDILLAVECGDFAALVLLHLSTAFDTVDHVILLRRLQTSFGNDGFALDWFQSCLVGRTNDLTPHLYADDTEVYSSCSPCDADSFRTRVSQCTCAVVEWMQSNRLQLNCNKTDFAWLTTNRSLRRLPTTGPTIGSVTVVPSQTLCELGVYIDADLTMRTHVQRIASRGFTVLRRLCSIRHYFPTSMFRSLVSAFVLNRLDYCNSLLVDLPAVLLQRHQAVQNSVARLIYRLRRSEHITDALLSLHWLRVQERIEYKVAVLTYKALNGLALPYLSTAFTRV